MTALTRRGLGRPAARPRRPGAPTATTLALEAVALLAAPAVLFLVLRLRAMAPVQLTDPSMHTTFIVDPHDIFLRYQAAFEPTSRLREAARVGFLVPARLFYLLFGVLGGFFVWRYALALVAIVPVYLLLRRLFGRWAGFVGVAVVMSSPVAITAWGTDYPDSAALSYLSGAFALLALSLRIRRRRTPCLAIAGTLLSCAVWSHGIAVPLVAVLGGVYLAVRLLDDRPGLARDVLVLALCGVATTAVLAVASKLLIGQLDFIGPTLRAEAFLSTPAQERLWHSTSWRWAPYDLYLLVPPVVVGAFAVVFARRWRSRDPATVFVGVCGSLQLALFAYLQFLSHVQALEIHFLSSPLWSSTNLMLAMVIAGIAGPGRPASRVARRLTEAVPALLVLAVAIVYGSLGPRIPAMTWTAGGWELAAAALLAAVLGRLLRKTLGNRGAAGGARLIASSAMAAAVTALVLVLTVAPGTAHRQYPGTVNDPPPAYAGALGGDATPYLDQYRVTAALPGFVGHAAYRGEQLMTWWSRFDGQALVGPIGIYHSSFNTISYSFPKLNATARARVAARRPAQILLLSLTGRNLPAAARALAPYSAIVVRRRELRSGSYRLHVWLLDLLAYLRRSRSAISR